MKTKKNTIITLLLIALPAVLLAASKLEVKESKFNFGYIPQNCNITHNFWFISAGEDTLKINKIKTGCSCAVMPLEKDWIAPGDSMQIGIHWKIKREAGEAAKNPAIYTNAKADPYRIGVAGSVMKNPMSDIDAASISPYIIELAKVGNKSIDSLSFEITNKLEYEVSVNIIESNIEQCILTLPELLGPFEVFTAMAVVKPEFLDQEFTGSVTIELSGPKDTRITIPIRRKIYNSSSQ